MDHEVTEDSQMSPVDDRIFAFGVDVCMSEEDLMLEE